MINVTINKDWIPFIVIAALAFVLLGQCSSNSALREDVKVLEVQVENERANYEAAHDSVEIYRNANGYLEAEIKTYVSTAEQLEVQNERLLKKYRKALNLNKDLEGVNLLLSSEIKLKDSLLISSTINADSTFMFKDSADFGDNNTRVVTLNGLIDSNQITGKLSIYQTISLLAALEKEDGVNRMRISTKYPFDDIKIEGIDLINNELNTYKKKSRWNMNFGVGYGIYPVDGSMRATPFVGVVFGYSPKWLQF